MKNTALHSGIKRSPYEAIFGSPAKIGLKSINLPDEVYRNLQDEDDLSNALNQMYNFDGVNSEEVVNNSEEEDAEVALDCIDCNKICHEITKCSECLNPLHNMCAKKGMLCFLCFQKVNIANERCGALSGLESQAKRMLDYSNSRISEAKIGDTVRIPVPDVDRGKADARNILGVVMETSEGFFKIGTPDGILNQLYSRNQFTICQEKLIDVASIPTIQLPLRTIATAQSLGTGQGMVKCSCKSKCTTKKCSCRKNDRLCNSRCHSSMPCDNKN